MNTLIKPKAAGISVGHIVSLIEGGTFPFTITFVVLGCREIGEVMVNFRPKYYDNVDGTRVRVGAEVETMQAFDYNNLALSYLADGPHGGMPGIDRGIATDIVDEVRVGYIMSGKKETGCLKPEGICWLAGKISERGGAKMSCPLPPSSGNKNVDMIDEYRQMLDIDKVFKKVRHVVDDADVTMLQAKELAGLINDCLSLAKEISETRREIHSLFPN